MTTPNAPWRHRYYIAGDDGGRYSADAGDYWSAPDAARLHGALVREDHVWRTSTGRMVRAPRLIVEDARVRHLRRLERHKR